MLCVLFLFSHEDVLVDVLSVNKILLFACPLHPVEVAKLLNGEIVRLKLVSLLIVCQTLIIFVCCGARHLQLGKALCVELLMELLVGLRSVGRTIRKLLLGI